VLAILLVVGSLSDYIGRRPVLLAATLIQAAAMAVFATAHSVDALLAARVIQGLSTGAATAAVGAGMLDIDRAKGTIANSIAPMLGTASGGLISGVLVQYLPAPTQLVYLVFGAIFVTQAIGVAAMPESVTPRPGALASLRPQLHVPAPARPAMLVAAPALVAAWALAGFYGSIGPAVVRWLVGSKSPLLGGMALFILSASGAAAVLATRKASARRVLVLGTAALVTGTALSLIAISTTSILVFAAGLVVAGAGFGTTFQGAIRTILPLASARERAGVLSVLYVIAYMAMGVPAVIGGIRFVHGGGVVTTAREYGVAVMGLAALALVGTLLRSRSPAPAAVPVSPSAS
jgi:predicted MFS family arabinose efflux permease